MAFGTIPKHSEDLYFDKFTPHQFLILGVETLKSLEWEISSVNENGFVAYINKGDLKWNAKITFNLEEEKATIKSESAGGEIIDLGRNKKTVNKFTHAFYGLKYSLAPEDLDQKFSELKLILDANEQDALNQPPLLPEKKFGFFSIFIPREGFFITSILIDLNILIFILMVISGVSFIFPDTESLLKWGANFRPLTLDGEWWRLLTCCFLHIGVIHLLMNMYALLFIGVLLEPLLGRTRFLAAYLLTGITASVASLSWHELTVSAGASGAIFGMYGVFLAMLTTNLIDKAARKALLTSIGTFVAYNLLYGMQGGVDNAAHIGGLVSGLVTGYLYFPGLKKPGQSNLKYGSIGLLLVLVLLTSFVVCSKVQNDIPKYEKRMQVFVTNEAMALEIFSMPDNTPKEKLLSEIKDRGLYYWDENIKLLREVDQLSLPEFVHDRNKKMIEYCDLRIKSYNLLYRDLNRDVNPDSDSLKIYNSRIETIINSLKGNKN